ncbi:hypothetical protein [Undibacterium aquatile]|uniref:Uncharacterized protein n=1 Tax=Undibacterium aquatile TaxID=1537398 RepID=A0ABR6XCY0_9BURK|nr:hypothetical protein [Undibacterium aquatile]MBC3810701.1 hypothetical protein [Undibacterium aquatile]
MQIATILILVGTVIASAAYAWRKQWVLSLAWFFSLAYTIFDKVFPFVLPEHLVTAFPSAFLALVLISCWQNFSRKKGA